MGVKKGDFLYATRSFTSEQVKLLSDENLNSSNKKNLIIAF